MSFFDMKKIIFYLVLCSTFPLNSLWAKNPPSFFPPVRQNYAWGAKQSFLFYSGITNLQGDLKNKEGQKPYGWLLGTGYYYSIFPSLSVGAGILLENFNFNEGIYGESAAFSHISFTANVRYQVNNLFKRWESSIYPFVEVQIGFSAIVAEEDKVTLSVDLDPLEGEDYMVMAGITNVKAGARFSLTDWIAFDASVGLGLAFTNADLLDFCDPSNQGRNVDYPDYAMDYKFSLNMGLIVTIKGPQSKYSLMNSRTKQYDAGKRKKINRKKLF